jgi:hypothetical protein
MEKGDTIGNVIPFPRRSKATAEDDDEFPLGRFFRLAEGDHGVVFSVNEPVTIQMTPAQAEEIGLALIQAAYLSRLGK